REGEGGKVEKEKLRWHQKQSPPGERCCSRLEALPESKQAPEAARARDGERQFPAGRFCSGFRAAVTQQHPSHSDSPVWQVSQHTNPRQGGQACGGSQEGNGKGFFLVVRPAVRVCGCSQRRHEAKPAPEGIFLSLALPSSPRHAGISGKSQILFALVFTTRYLDLFTTFISAYNTVMKVIFLICAYVTVYMIYVKFRKTFDSENDSFRLEFLLVPVTGLSFLENHSFTPLEILWTFSIYLESVAILPQLFMISKTGEAETITTHYLFFLGLYRALYIANWVWRYHTEKFYDQIAVVSGVVQTIFYCDFFYLYVTKGCQNQ
uniref:ER lumen protein-retaining receptor n=1 Tax=Anser brachyrhynchus TaxID=132585 RepID=A0A8B9BBC5_9AVES